MSEVDPYYLVNFIREFSPEEADALLLTDSVCLYCLVNDKVRTRSEVVHVVRRFDRPYVEHFYPCRKHGDFVMNRAGA